MGHKPLWILIIAFLGIGVVPTSVQALADSRLSKPAVHQQKAPWWPTKRERGTYQARLADSGKSLWKVDWETTTQQDQDHSWIEIQEKGQGQPLKYKTPIHWQKRILFQTEPVPQIHSLEGSRWDEAGNLISQQEIQLNPKDKTLLYTDTESNRPGEKGEFPWIAGTIPDELLFHWIRTLPFDPSIGIGVDSSDFYLLVSPTHRFRMRAQVKGEDTIATPAGTFPCYRVELRPQMGMLSKMAPKTTLWCTKEAPHYWVRYEGLIGGPGSPKAVIELVKFEQN